jgi:hypothetical protein
VYSVDEAEVEELKRRLDEQESLAESPWDW